MREKIVKNLKNFQLCSLNLPQISVYKPSNFSKIFEFLTPYFHRHKKICSLAHPFLHSAPDIPTQTKVECPTAPSPMLNQQCSSLLHIGPIPTEPHPPPPSQPKNEMVLNAGISVVSLDTTPHFQWGVVSTLHCPTLDGRGPCGEKIYWSWNCSLRQNLPIFGVWIQLAV